MPRLGITRTAVFQAAQQLVHQKEKPTVDNIRELLGSGSKVTIHKYLKFWKEQKFLGDESTNTLETKVTELEALLAKQSKLADHLAKEQMQLQKQYLNLELEKQELTRNNELKTNLINNLSMENANLKIVVEELKTARETAIKLIINDKNKTIEQLNLELSKIHSKSLELIRETSAKGHDLLMEVKVANINLEAKLNEQTKKNMQLTKDLQEQQLLQIRSEQKISLYEQKLLELLDKTEIANLGIK